MAGGTCFIVGSGDFTARDLAPEPQDLVLAADGGYTYLHRLGVKPDLVAGDFDSLGEAPAGEKTLRYPVEKDDTDMGIAAQLGYERGYRRFSLYGGSGDRPDHFYANLQLLTRLSRLGCEARLTCPRYTVFALTDGRLALPAKPAGAVVSVFCAGERAEGVTLQGLRYPLSGATLTCDFALGVSNEYTGADAFVEVKRGTLHIFCYETVA